MSRFVGEYVLAPGRHFVSCFTPASSTTVRYPFDGEGVASTVPGNSQTRNDLLCQICQISIYSASAPGFLIVKNHDGVDQFRVSYAIISAGQFVVPLGAGVLIPSGFSVATSANGCVYTIMYRRLTGKRVE